MSPIRRTGAPRLIDWTGERCVPWSPDVQVVYEHFHRYLWAAQLTARKRVLDLASGEGFGAALLAETAARVVGVDIDATSVRHAQLNYSADHLEYVAGDARDLSRFADGSFDVVVAFEVIEHVTEQDTVMAEIKRVLVPDGLLIASTPDRDVYDAGAAGNPFHARELSETEFDELLGAHFAHRRLWAQHVVSGSELRAIGADGHTRGTSGHRAVSASSFLLEPDGDGWRPGTELPLLYMVALASDADLPRVPAASSLADPQQVMVSHRLWELADRLNAEISAREHVTSELRSRLHDVQVRYERLAADAFTVREAYGLRMVEQAAVHARAAGEAAAREAAVRGELDAVRAARDWRELQLQRVEASIIWRATMRLRGTLIRVLGGEGGLAVRAVQAGLRLLWRLAGNRPGIGPGADPPAEPEATDTAAGAGPESPDASPFEPVALDLAEDPVLSIVMPLFAGAELTHRALQSIRDNTFYTRYEVILVNDGDDPATAELLQCVTGARVVTNEENLGYLASVNRGAQLARGRWLVLANNDIEVLPNWAAELLDCGESAEDIAIVTPMYLQPDGLISEAGAIVWNDASAHNYGRGDQPDAWRYGWRREVDYGSAAALLVRADVWREVGGFDERFAPMYYEDADLCFAARALGYRVMFEPQARIVHREGSTAGTDESAGHKRHQAVNRPRFREKWEEVLTREHLPAPEEPYDTWAGATARRGDRVLVIDYRMPFWDREAGALRTLELLKALMARGHHVTFVPDNGANTEPYASRLQRMGIEVVFGADLLVQLSLVIAPHIHATIVSRPSVASRYMALLRRHAPDATLIYDTVDLHWVRESREAAQRVGHPEAELLTREALWTQSLELALVRAADVTLVATALERARVEREVPDAVIRVLPTINAVRPDAPGVSGRSGIIFVGGFQHAPNVEAVLRLITRVMPLVWAQLPEVTVRVVGADVPDRVAELADDRVEILGWVAELDPLLDAARLTLAPLTYGAGMKGKVTQALAVGLPVVTTPIGAEGLETADGAGLLVGADDTALAEHAIRVLTDDALWERLAASGRELVGRQCSPEVVMELVTDLLETGAYAVTPS